MKKVILVFIMAVSVCFCGCSVNGKNAIGMAEKLFNGFVVSEADTGHDRYNSPYDEEKGKTVYAYYFTKEEMLEEIEKGYIFHLDTLFREETRSAVEGRWPFHVYENNMVNLEIEISDPFPRAGSNVDSEGGKVMVKLISPDGKCVYHFEKRGQDITKNISVKEQIPVIAGEWELRISFSHIDQGPLSCLKISAAYEIPSEKEIRWLRRNRLKEPCGR